MEDGSKGIKATASNTVLKYIKSGVLKFQNSSEFAVGCSVEAVLLDKNGDETSKRFYGTVNNDGNVIDSFTKEVGINLGEVGAYKVYFKGQGMNIVETGGNSSVEVPYSEIYNAQSTKGFVTSVLNEYRMEIDYETSQLKFFKTIDNVEHLIMTIGINVDTLGLDGAYIKNGILVFEGSQILMDNGDIDALSYIGSQYFVRNAHDEVNTMTRGLTMNVTAKMASEDKTSVFELALQNLDLSINQSFSVGNFHRGLLAIFKRWGTSVGDSWFLYDDVSDGKSFLRGKLGIGTGKETPTQDIDVANNINADGGFIQGGTNVGITDGINFMDGSGMNHKVTISGGIITEWLIA